MPLSGRMDESSPDLITKYQKLAAEYSKMRAQTTVLKKAIAEEQAKGSEMKEILKEKDQAIRKLEQEVECLNFRNLQLIKRVAVLQDDLEAVDDKAKKTKNKVLPSSPAPVTSETQSILNAELLSRIEENEKLHHQVYASEVEHKKIVEDLTATVESLQTEMSKQHSVMSEAIKKHEATIDKLSQERAKMEVTLKNYEKEVKDTKLNEEICKEELQYVRNDLGHKLEEKKRIIEEKILFNDTRHKFQNSLNVPVLLRRKHDQLSSALADLGGFVSELVRRLSDLHTYMEQKINSLEPDADMCGPIKKFGAFLHENAQYLKAIEVAFADFVARIQKDPSAWLEAFSLKGISKALSRYVRYLDKLLPYLLLSIQAENCTKGTTPRLEETHKRLQVVAEGLTYGFSKLERCFQLLVEIASPEKNGVYCVSQSVLVRRIITCLHCLHMSFEEARKVFSSKVVLEHQMPTSTEKMKSTDDCILSSLVSVVTGIKKITILMEDNVEVLMCEVPYRPRGLLSQKKLNINPCVSTLRERGLNYMILTNSDEALSVPYELAMKNSQSLQNFADTRENLTQQLSTCKSKLSKLEQDKEYWMLECQLLQAKQSRTGNSPTQDNFDISSEDGQAFQSFLKESINQLVTQIQFADSKSVAFHTECAFLQQKLQLAEQKRDGLEKEITDAKNVITRLKEEHKTMMKSYEDQLSMMSEHLATMNETLTLQKDEIDALRQAGNSKASKKVKGK